MQQNEFFCNGQAQAKVLLGFAGTVAPIKAVEYMGLLFIRYACAMVDLSEPGPQAK